MKCCGSVMFSAAVMAFAQVGSVAIKPAAQAVTTTSSTNAAAGSQTRTAAAGMPVSGYVLGPGPAELHPILLKGKPQLGEPAIVPGDTRRLYVPPRQQYALVEHTSEEPVAVWPMHRAVTIGNQQEQLSINGAMAHPDLVAFSPRGSALALYSQRSGGLQIVSNLPAQPSVLRELSFQNLQAPALIAISDDAAVVVAGLADGGLMLSSNGELWRSLSIGFAPQAWSFLPNTHDLAISDMTQKMIVLLPNIDEKRAASRVLAQDVRADHLTLTKDGEQMLAANFSAAQIWIINLKTGTITPRQETAKVDTLTSLRDGFTFLLSTSPGLSLVKLDASPELHDPNSDSGTAGLMQSGSGTK